MKRWTAVTLLVLLAGTSAWAVKPVTVSHTTQADFSSAEAKNVVVWSLGEVTLGRAAKTIVSQREDVSMVSTIAGGAKGESFVGTATKGIVLRLAPDGTASVLADLDGILVTDLLLDGTRLLASTAGGTNAGVFAIDLTGPAGQKGKVVKVWADRTAPAVWGLAKIGQTVYAATSPEAKVYAIDPAGKATVVFTAAKQKTIRAIAAANGKLYAGTTDDGLVYQIDPVAKTSRVILDATEREIVSLQIDQAGNVYAAATNGGSGSPSSPSGAESGRPGGSMSRPASTRPTPPAGDNGSPKAPPSTTGPANQPTSATAQPTSDAGETVAPAPAVPGGNGGGSDSLVAIATSPSASTQPAGSGGPTSKPGVNPGPAAPPSPSQPSGSPTSDVGLAPRMSLGGIRPPGGEESGNTVYRIDPDGFVKPITKQSQTLLGMVLVGQKLILATGGAGLVYEVDLKDNSTASIAKLDPKQVTAIAAEPDGTILAGTTGPAIVAKIGGGLAPEGTLISKPVDAKQIARWGKIRVEAELPDRAEVTVATRSGNTAEASDETWSTWSAEIPANSGWSAIGSPAGRFLQYRLTFKAPGGKAGVVDGVQLVYQVANLAPEMEAVLVVPSDKPQPGGGAGPGGSGDLSPKRYRIVAAKASDPNGDTLRYNVFYRKVGAEVWIQAAKDLTNPMYPWDTTTVADGSYEVKAEVADSADNSPATALTDSRISRQVVVDNTPPVLAELTAEAGDEGTVKLSATIRDAGSRVQRAEYVVDSGDTYTTLEASDGIFDSPTEKATATIKDLKPGPHVITVKTADEFGNVGYGSVTVVTGR